MPKFHCAKYHSVNLIKKIDYHGLSKTKFYSKWFNILKRCYKPKSHGFKYYGGLGIICEWKNFREFRDDMFQSYQEHINKFGYKNTTLDRIDNSKNYCRENCRWATVLEQIQNRRPNGSIFK